MGRVKQGISLADLAAQGDRVGMVVEKVRKELLAPGTRKRAPTFYQAHIQGLTGLTKSAVEHRIKDRGMPGGTISPGGGRRVFSLADARVWARSQRTAKLRPAGAGAITIAAANFKGGVSKTTTTLALAQALSLRGHRVLAVDCDPQGSLTTLFGILPETEVAPEDTILPLVTGQETSVAYAIRPTYWDGVDLVPAQAMLFGAEHMLPARRGAVPFWKVLDAGLDAVRADYDIIIIDTPPSLGYVTINALMAADGVIMPLPMNQLDFASSAQFWRLFSDVARKVAGPADGDAKRFAFVNVLPSRVDVQDLSGATVRAWAKAAYRDKLLDTEIPKSAAMAAASAELFGTVFDGSGGASRQATKRALEAFDALADVIENQIGDYWRQQIAECEAVA